MLIIVTGHSGHNEQAGVWSVDREEGGIDDAAEVSEMWEEVQVSTCFDCCCFDCFNQLEL